MIEIWGDGAQTRGFTYRAIFRQIAAGRPLAPSLERSVGAGNVVIPSHSGLEVEVLLKVATHPFREELLPAVSVLGHCGIGVALAERLDVRRFLFLGGVDASRR